MTLPANWTAGQQFTASAENAVETAVNALTNAAPTNGAYSSRPTAGNAGKIYMSTDNAADYMDNGSSWVKTRIEGRSCSAQGSVPTSGWTAVNMQSGASFAASSDDMLFTIPSVGSSMTHQYQYRTYPTPPFTLTTYLDVNQLAPSTSGWSSCGIVISDGTKLVVFGPQYGGNGTGQSAAGWNVWAAKYSAISTFSAIYGDWPVAYFGSLPRWYRVTDDNTNLTYQCSVNGIEWITVGGPEARTTFLTPSRIGLGGGNFTGNNLLVRCRSWNGVA